MRQLTQTEIEKAPEWATHYGICEDNDVLFENEEFFTFASKPKKKLGQLFGVDEDSKPIPRKEFDITKYKFSDNGISHSFITYSGLFLNCDDGITLSKKDIVAMAKAVKLTAEDLK